MDDQTNTSQNSHVAPDPIVIAPGTVSPQLNNVPVEPTQPIATQSPIAQYSSLPQYNGQAMSHNSTKRKKPIIPIIVVLIVLFLGIDAYLFTKYKNRVPEAVTKQASTKDATDPGNTQQASPTDKPQSSTPTAPKNTPSPAPAVTTPQSASDAAKQFISLLQTNKQAEVDAMISPAFKEEIKQQIGKESYFEYCATQCAARLVNLSKATVTSDPYKSSDGSVGEIVTFKTPRNEGGFNTLGLTIIKVSGKYVVDTESDGATAN